MQNLHLFFFRKKTAAGFYFFTQLKLSATLH